MKRRVGMSGTPSTKRTSRTKFTPISEEMKEWPAMLASELDFWPGVATKSMFGLVCFYLKAQSSPLSHRPAGFSSAASLIFKFNPTPPALLKRAQDDHPNDTSTRRSGQRLARL